MSNPYDNRTNEWDAPSAKPQDYPPTQQFPPQQQVPQYHQPPYMQQGPYSYGDYQHGQWQPSGLQAEPEKKSSKAPLWIALGAVIAAALGGAGYVVYRANAAGQSEPVTSTVVVTSTSPMPSTPAGAETANADPKSAEPSKSAADEEKERAKEKEFAPGKSETSKTSPEFASVVGEDFAAYYGTNGEAPKTLESYSPRTGYTYTMTCVRASGGFRCTGGDNASVFIGER